VQQSHGILVVNVFHNRSFIDLDTLVSTENYLHEIKLSKQVLLIIFTITVSLVLVVCLVAIMRISACRKENHSCAEQNSAKSSSRSENLERCGRQYSSTSLRHTECSSRTSSNTALACVQQQQVNNNPHQQAV